MTAAEDGFNLARTSVALDADRLRSSSAALLELGAGKLIYEKFQAFGLTDDHIEDLAVAGYLESVMAEHATAELEIIAEYEQRIEQTDSAASAALGGLSYYTRHVLGFTRKP